jgi:hypothetical protein
MLQDIQLCEKFFKKSTTQFMREFKDNDYEVNVDQRQWYRFAHILINKGYNIDSILK